MEKTKIKAKLFPRWGIKNLERPSILGVLHKLARVLLQADGYRFEVRQSGDLKMGLWRKKLFKSKHVEIFPKRLVVIPGFGDSPLSWYPSFSLLGPILKRDGIEELILFDFPGYHGFLTEESCFPNMRIMLDFCSDMLDSLRPHSIIGYSLGGWIASAYSNACGSKKRPLTGRRTYGGPKRLILVAPAAITPGEEGLEGLFRRSTQEGFQALRPYFFSSIPLWFRWLPQHLAHFLEREDIQMFIKSSLDRPKKGCSENILPLKITELAKNIEASVYLIWGTKDRLIPARSALLWLEALKSKNKNPPEAIFIHRVGHCPQIEKPVIFSALLAQIFSSKIPYSANNLWWTSRLSVVQKKPKKNLL